MLRKGGGDGAIYARTARKCCLLYTSGTSGMVSNVVARGETVYAISGMSGALVAAQVDGSTRVFQRVSYAGTAIIGSETLADTLCDPADAVSYTHLDVYKRQAPSCRRCCGRSLPHRG